MIKKSFYEPMIAKSGPYMHGHVGLIWEPGQKVSQIKLRAFNGIYLPPQDFTLPDPLPEEWLEILPNILFGSAPNSPIPPADSEMPSIITKEEEILDNWILTLQVYSATIPIPAGRWKIRVKSLGNVAE